MGEQMEGDSRARRRTAREGRYPPISSYAFLSDTHTAALVGPDGAVEWLCVPRFDGESVAARLLDRERGGALELEVDGAGPPERRYVGDTLVLESVFRTPSGFLVLQECLAVAHARDGDELAAEHVLVRLVHCREGHVRLRARVHLRRATPRAAPRGGGRRTGPGGRRAPSCAVMAGTPRPDAPVLCGIDHEAAWQVVAVAANLAVALGTRLHVLHAVPAPVPEGLTLAARGQEARARERARTRGGELLDELRAELDGVPADLELVDLPPAIALPRRAAELDAAAVVVGTRARGRLADLALGSVSAAVVRDADRPVVVVPPDGVAGLRRGAPVVVGVDGSREAQAAVRAAGDLTAALGGELVLLHVLEDGTAGSAIAAAAGPLDDGGEPPSVAQQALRRAATWVDLDVQLVPRLRRGPVVGELLAECEERGAAALALAPRRRGPAAAALLGSVTREAVRRATVPVLVVRGG